MPKSEQQQGAANKYLRENVETFVVRVPKGKKASIQEFAKNNDGSLNKFVNRAIDETMERDKTNTESI